MKAARPSDLRTLLREAGVRPSRRLGQNFLVDGNLARIAVAAAGLEAGGRVLEIGPGAGALTEGLLETGARVLAVEIDSRLARALRRRWAGEPRIEIRTGDALAIPAGELLDRGTVRTVVSNLPYASGTRILVNLVRADPPPRRMVLTLQTEVARRLDAAPGGPDYGPLALWTQRLYTVEILRTVPPTCFYPAPGVESALVRLSLRARPLAALKDPDRHAAFTRWVFRYRRKQLARILATLPAGVARLDTPPAAWLRSLGVRPEARPAELSVGEWARLSNALAD